VTATRDLGILGERVAERHLRDRGYTVLERNHRFGHREVDLIVARGDLIVFVEVKTRAGPGYGHPLEAITPRKRREIERVARRWQARYGRPGLLYRFDAVAIQREADGRIRVEHVPNAWRLGE
jgi:putative endonuclease